LFKYLAGAGGGRKIRYDTIESFGIRGVLFRFKSPAKNELMSLGGGGVVSALVRFNTGAVPCCAKKIGCVSRFDDNVNKNKI
jgi:hypothetical protein